MTRRYPTFPGDIGEPCMDPPDDDEDAEGRARARARAVLGIIREELEGLATLDPDDRGQMIKDLETMKDRLAYEHRHEDWGAYCVLDVIRDHLLDGGALPMSAADMADLGVVKLRATLEEAAREPQFEPDFEPAWEE